jgi:hypothetical protein
MMTYRNGVYNLIRQGDLARLGLAAVRPGLENLGMLRLSQETLKDVGPSAPQGANVNWASRLGVQVGDGAVVISHNGLLLQREEGRDSVFLRGIRVLLPIGRDELVSISESSRRACSWYLPSRDI